MARVIYLSPSNHGAGANKCLKKGCYEDKHTRPIANAAAKYLKLNGFEVIVASKNKTMAQRCKESDKAGADLHIPIHTNASGSASARYLMFMCIAKTGEYKKLFNAIAPEFEKIYPGKKEAVFAERDDLYEINVPNAKTFYLELGFHTNRTDCDDFIHDSDKLGKALAKGICEYYGVKFKDGETKETYKVRVIVDSLKVRKGPGTNYAVNSYINDKGIYTIVEKKGNWGKLKSGAGWINTSSRYCKKA